MNLSIIRQLHYDTTISKFLNYRYRTELRLYLNQHSFTVEVKDSWCNLEILFTSWNVSWRSTICSINPENSEGRLTPNIVPQILLYFVLVVMYIQVHCSIINSQHINGSFIKSNSIRWLVRTHRIVHDNLSTLIKAVHWYGQDNDPSQKFKTNEAIFGKHWSLIRIIKPDEIPPSRIPLLIISVLTFFSLGAITP